jgi:hypothetical protein
VDRAHAAGCLRRADRAAVAVGTGSGGAGDDVLVDFPCHRDPSGHTIDIGAPELEQLALAEADVPRENDEQSVGHVGGDRCQLVERHRYGHAAYAGGRSPRTFGGTRSMSSSSSAAWRSERSTRQAAALVDSVVASGDALQALISDSVTSRYGIAAKYGRIRDPSSTR